MKPFTPGIYGMLQHVITSLVLNENPFCQIYKLYKILLCNTFLEGQRIFPVIHKSWEGYWDGNRTSVFLGHRASELIKIDQPGLRMHSIRQRLEVDRSGADLPDTQGTHFSSTDRQRPSGARKQRAIASGRICHKVHENPQESKISKDITRHVPDYRGQHFLAVQ
jgi:hypothetical protein